MPVIDPPFWTHHPLVGPIPALSPSPWEDQVRQKAMSLSDDSAGGVFRGESAITLSAKTPDTDQNCPECGGPHVRQCRCRLSDRVCENGHEWHYCPDCRTRVSGPSYHDGSGDNRCEACRGEVREKGAYASTQIDLPNIAVSKLAQLAAVIRPEDLADDGIERESHITIKYGLLCRSETVQSIVKDSPPVEYEVGGFKVFEHDDKPDVLYLTVTSRDLIRLNRLLSDLPCKPDSYPEYIPHVTIAYVKAGTGAVYAAALNGVLDLRMKGTAREFVFSDPDRRLTTITLADMPAVPQLTGLSLPAALVPGEEVREKGSELVRAVLAEGTPDQLDGLTVWYSEIGPRYWIDQADWHESGFGKAVILAAEDELDCVAEESNQFKLEPDKGVYVSNESGPKDIKEWERIYPPREREKAAGNDHHEFMDDVADEAVALLGGREREKAFNPDEARDDHGRWIEGGAGVHGRVASAMKAGHHVRVTAPANGGQSAVNARITKVDGEYLHDASGRKWHVNTLAERGAKLSAHEPPSPSPSGQQASDHINVRAEIKKAGNDAEKALPAIGKRLSDHMASGGKVVAWMDGKRIPIAKVEGTKLVDEKGQPWGMLPLAMGLPGTKTGIELLPSTQSPAPPSGQSAPVERHNPDLDEIMSAPPTSQPKGDDSRLRHNPTLDDLFDPKPPAEAKPTGYSAPSPQQPSPTPPLPEKANPVRRPIPTAAPGSQSQGKVRPGQVSQRVNKNGKRMATPIPLPPKMARRAIPVARRLAQRASKSLGARAVLKRADQWADRIGAAHADRVAHRFGGDKAKAAKALAAVIRHLCRAANASGESASANLGGHKFTITRKRQKGFDPDDLFTPFDPNGTNSSRAVVKPVDSVCSSCGSPSTSPWRSPVYQNSCDGCGAKFGLSRYGQAKGYPEVMPVGFHAVTNHAGRFIRIVAIETPKTFTV